MQAKIFTFLFIFYILTTVKISLAGETPVCGQNYIPLLGPSSAQENFKSIELIKGEIIPSPFSFACQNGIRKGEAPGFMTRSLPNRDLRGNSSQDFFRLIAEKVKLYLARNQQESEKLLKCFAGDSLKCEEKSINKIQTAASAARGHLALMQALESLNAPAELGPDFTQGSSAAPNGLAKGIKWSRYSDAEYKEARLVAKHYKDEAIAEVTKSQKISPSKIPPERQVRKVLELLAAHHMYEYRKLMINNLSLQFISSEHPSYSEIKSSLVQLDSNRRLEQAEMNKVIGKIDQNPNGFDRNNLWLLNYKFLVEETLVEHPQFCSLASSLDKLSSNLETHKVLVLLGLSAILPPLIASIGGGAAASVTVANLAIGGTTSYLYLGDSYSQLKKAEQAARVGPFPEFAIKSQSDVDEADSNMKLGVAITPLMFKNLSIKQIGVALGASVFLGLPRDQLNQTAPSTLKTSGEVFKKVGESGIVTRAKPTESF